MGVDTHSGCVYPGKGLSIKQLLHALKLEVTRTVVHRPPDMTFQYVMELEEEATSTVACIRQLLNAFNTTAQLPQDIILVILSFLPEDRDLFAISRVCRRWRTIVVSYPVLWRRMDCRNLNRTRIGLERHRSVPLRLELDGRISIDALEMVLKHGSKITSLSMGNPYPRIQQLHPRLLPPPMEELALFLSDNEYHISEQELDVRIYCDLLSIRKLFVSGRLLPIDQITAPNLMHLSLEFSSQRHSTITVHSVLNMLRRSPQLETILINIVPADSEDTLQLYDPVILPKLQSIELGRAEVWSGLIIHLRFPPGVAVGFRDMDTYRKSWPCYSIQHTLAAIDIESVTFACIRDEGFTAMGSYLFRFEGPGGSLEVKVSERNPFGHEGLLLSHFIRLENVKRLRVMDYLIDRKTLGIIASAMHNLTSINFTGRSISPGSLVPERGSRVLFPHLKHIAGLPPSRELVDMARERKNRGAPLGSLDVTDDPVVPEYVTEVKEVVGDVRVWGCADLPRRWTSNAVLDVWERAGYRGPDLLSWIYRQSIEIPMSIPAKRNR